MQLVEVKKSHICCDLKALLACISIAVAAFSGCASSKSSSYMLDYQRIGAWFVVQDRGCGEVTELYIDCQRQVKHGDCSFRLLVDGSLAAHVTPWGSELKLESRGFVKKDDVFRLSYEGGFIEIRMSGRRVAAIAVKKEIADKGPQIEVCIAREGLVHEMPTVISLPANVAQIESNLRMRFGSPSCEGQAE